MGRVGRSPVHEENCNRRLQPLRYLRDCSDCFRLERLPGGACTHWKAPPLHGARQMRSFLCGYRRSRPYIPTRSRPGIPIGSRPPLASIAWVDLMMSLRDEKVKRPVDLERVAFAF